jgi:hypothetical protein
LLNVDLLDIKCRRQMISTHRLGLDFVIDRPRALDGGFETPVGDDVVEFAQPVELGPVGSLPRPPCRECGAQLSPASAQA